MAHLRRLGSLGHSLRRPPFPPFPLQHYRSFTAGGIVPSPTDSNHPDAHTDFLALHDRLLAEYRRQCGPGQPEFVPVYSSHDQNEVYVSPSLSRPPPSFSLYSLLSPSFSNNEINMRRLEVYGFDYDVSAVALHYPYDQQHARPLSLSPPLLMDPSLILPSHA